MMARCIRKQKEHVLTQQSDFGDGETVLTPLYEAYNEVHRMDNDQIKADLNELYRQIN